MRAGFGIGALLPKSKHKLDVQESVNRPLGVSNENIPKRLHKANGV